MCENSKPCSAVPQNAEILRSLIELSDEDGSKLR
jgi:hypothetical protein